MSIQGYLYIEATLSLRELVTLLGFSTEKELPPPFLHNETHIQIDLLPLDILIMSDEEYNEAAPYGIESDFRILISSHIYYEEFLKLIAEIVKTTPYNLGLFMTHKSGPTLIRKDQKLTLDGDPDKGLPEWLEMFKDIPYETAEF